MNLKNLVKQDIYEILKNDIEFTDIIVENPKDRNMADYAIPCFTLARKLKKSPMDIASYIKDNLKDNYEKVEVVNGYVNIFFKRELLTKNLIETITGEKTLYGNNDFGLNKTVVIDYSSPNIAKPFGVGHLRSTTIGNAIKNICLKCGYKVVSINHLGDWGTQFGKIICAYKMWGNEEKIKANPIKELSELYVRFHDEATSNPALEDAARK